MPKPLISIQMEPGKWYRLDSPEITECCECSLVHVTEYMLEGGKLFWRSKIDKGATKAKRKENRLRVVRG